MAALGQALTAVSAEASTARLRFPLGVRPQVEAFVAAESSCCPFFSFEQTLHENEIELYVSAPEDGVWAVRGLIAGFVAGWGGSYERA
jgi:hypothetical protein